MLCDLNSGYDGDVDFANADGLYSSTTSVSYRLRQQSKSDHWSRRRR
jgi:hypothetical protein